MGTNVVQWSNFDDQVRYQPISGILPVPLLLDSYPSTAAYSITRILRTDYSGSLIRVRRSSDNSEQDIGVVAGVLDTSSLTTFCSGTNGFIVTVYDQQGSNNATQATASSQPKIYDSSTGLITQNGQPAAHYYSANVVLNTSSAVEIMTSKRHSTFSVQYIVSGQAIPFSAFTNKLWTLGNDTANPTRVLYDGTWRTAAGRTVSTNTQYVNALLRVSDTTLDNYLNAASYTGIACGDVSFTSAVCGIGRHPTLPDGAGEHYVQELVHYASDESANQAAIRANINTFYGAY